MRLFRVLRVRGFGLLLAGQAINATGSWVAVIAIWGFAAFKFDVGPADLALLFVVLSARCSDRSSESRSTGSGRGARSSSRTCSACSTRSR
jgi:hypothetical protein